MYEFNQNVNEEDKRQWWMKEGVIASGRQEPGKNSPSGWGISLGLESGGRNIYQADTWKENDAEGWADATAQRKVPLSAYLLGVGGQSTGQADRTDTSQHTQAAGWAAWSALESIPQSFCGN